jgi:hypothetical protein
MTDGMPRTLEDVAHVLGGVPYEISDIEAAIEQIRMMGARTELTASGA